jgi:curved DNA-binding protein CbpA
MKNYWKVLSVKPSNTSSQIRSAYLAAMQKAHPDKGGSKEQAAIVNHAYEVLGTEESRQQYNEQRRAWASEIGASLCRCGHDARGKLNHEQVRGAFLGSCCATVVAACFLNRVIQVREPFTLLAICREHLDLLE